MSPAPRASWQARLLSAAIRVLVRRRSWGGERSLTRRARLLLGAPFPYQLLSSFGCRRIVVDEADARGEWLVPADPYPGVILYIHGGGFVSCSPATHRPITAAIARCAQRRVFSLAYRLAPEHRFPAAGEDARRAYEWLLSSGEQSIAIAGDSAGGNLVLTLAVSLRDHKRPRPACVVAFSPWTDLAGTGPSARENDGPDAMFRFENLSDFAAAYLGDSPASAPGASIRYEDLSALPPVLLHVGSTELLLDDARRVHDGIIGTGGKSRLEVYSDAPHGWQMLFPFVPEAAASIRDAAVFISQHLLRHSSAEKV